MAPAPEESRADLHSSHRRSGGAQLRDHTARTLAGTVVIGHFSQISGPTLDFYSRTCGTEDCEFQQAQQYMADRAVNEGSSEGGTATGSSSNVDATHVSEVDDRQEYFVDILDGHTASVVSSVLDGSVLSTGETDRRQSRCAVLSGFSMARTDVAEKDTASHEAASPRRRESAEEGSALQRRVDEVLHRLLSFECPHKGKGRGDLVISHNGTVAAAHVFSLRDTEARGEARTFVAVYFDDELPRLMNVWTVVHPKLVRVSNDLASAAELVYVKAYQGQKTSKCRNSVRLSQPCSPGSHSSINFAATLPPRTTPQKDDRSGSSTPPCPGECDSSDAALNRPLAGSMLRRLDELLDDDDLYTKLHKRFKKILCDICAAQHSFAIVGGDVSGTAKKSSRISKVTLRDSPPPGEGAAQEVEKDGSGIKSLLKLPTLPTSESLCVPTGAYFASRPAPVATTTCQNGSVSTREEGQLVTHGSGYVTPPAAMRSPTSVPSPAPSSPAPTTVGGRAIADLYDNTIHGVTDVFQTVGDYYLHNRAAVESALLVLVHAVFSGAQLVFYLVPREEEEELDQLHENEHDADLAASADSSWAQRKEVLDSFIEALAGLLPEPHLRRVVLSSDVYLPSYQCNFLTFSRAFYRRYRFARGQQIMFGAEKEKEVIDVTDLFGSTVVELDFYDPVPLISTEESRKDHSTGHRNGANQLGASQSQSQLSRTHSDVEGYVTGNVHMPSKRASNAVKKAVIKGLSNERALLLPKLRCFTAEAITVDTDPLSSPEKSGAGGNQRTSPPGRSAAPSIIYDSLSRKVVSTLIKRGNTPELAKALLRRTVKDAQIRGAALKPCRGKPYEYFPEHYYASVVDALSCNPFLRPQLTANLIAAHMAASGGGRGITSGAPSVASSVADGFGKRPSSIAPSHHDPAAGNSMLLPSSRQPSVVPSDRAPSMSLHGGSDAPSMSPSDLRSVKSRSSVALTFVKRLSGKFGLGRRGSSLSQRGRNDAAAGGNRRSRTAVEHSGSSVQLSRWLDAGRAVREGKLSNKALSGASRPGGDGSSLRSILGGTGRLLGNQNNSGTSLSSLDGASAISGCSGRLDGVGGVSGRSLDRINAREEERRLRAILYIPPCDERDLTVMRFLASEAI